MALQELLNLANNRKKIGISDERIDAIKPYLRQYISFWREYPDLMVDFMQVGGHDIYYKEDDNRYYKNDRGEEIKITFNLLFYQRVFLRVGMRFKYVYAVYPRRICAGNYSNIIKEPI